MKGLYTLLSAAVALLLVSAVPLPASSGESAEPPVRVFPPGEGRVLAREDTLPVLELQPIEVTSQRIPLMEIIRKAQEGERRKFEGLGTLAFNRNVKVTMKYGGGKPRTTCQESIQRVFFRSPDQWRSVTLRDTAYQVAADGQHRAWDRDDEKVGVTVTSNGSGRVLTDLPFYLERLDKFRFSILSRSINGRSVLYEVGFEPLSDFGMLPGGRLWLSTPEYQIVREEFELKNLPFSWILKKVDLLTREWQQVGGRWVEKRITGRADLGLGFLKIPQTVEIVVTFDHYAFDPVLDARLFEGAR